MSDPTGRIPAARRPERVDECVYAHARTTLLAAAAKDANNPYIRNNLALLEKSFRGGKAIQ